MADFDLNPITGQLDLVGASASYINGVVADPSELPTTVGNPALDSVYLAKAGSGVWLINRRPAGLYCRTANNGVAADWTHLGAFPEVNADGNWELYNTADPTKELKFDLSGISTGTTRTLTAPNASGTIALTSGTTFTTLAATNGTITASAPVLDLAQTWNNAAVTFTGLQLNITNTASVSAASGSKYFEIAVGGVPQIRFQRNFSTPYLYFGNTDTGIGAASTTLNLIANGGVAAQIGAGSSGVFIRSDAPYQWSSTTGVGAAADLQLFRDAADTLAQRRTTNAQTFRLYNTYTDATNFERLNLRWASNVAIIGTEKGSVGGSAKALELQTDGTTRFTIATSGAITCSSSLSVVSNLTFQGNASIVGNIASGVLRLVNSGSNDFNRLQFGGGTASFPALKRSSTVLQSRLADDSDFCPLQGQLRIHQNAVAETPTATHTMTLYDAAGTAYKVLCVAA